MALLLPSTARKLTIHRAAVLAADRMHKTSSVAVDGLNCSQHIDPACGRGEAGHNAGRVNCGYLFVNHRVHTAASADAGVMRMKRERGMGCGGEMRERERLWWTLTSFPPVDGPTRAV